jgi:hypothetical protein
MKESYLGSLQSFPKKCCVHIMRCTSGMSERRSNIVLAMHNGRTKLLSTWIAPRLLLVLDWLGAVVVDDDDDDDE